LEIAAGSAAAGCGSCGSQDTIGEQVRAASAPRAITRSGALLSADISFDDSISQ
jgi:hypothetical protein